MHYRLYRPEDFPQLYAIEEICFQPPIRFPRRYMRQLVGSAKTATWIAEQDQQMAGFAIVVLTRQSENTTAYIQTIEVSPAQRKHGIATELLSRIESSAIAAGAYEIGLHVAEGNTAAIRLYQAHGYLPRGREQNYYSNGTDGIIFSKSLG